MAEPGEILPERKIDYSVYDNLQNSKTSIESIIAKMLSIKKDGLSKSQLAELVTQMSLNFVSLRQANRSILIQEDHVKQETEHAKAPVDFTTLQLQNLMYEKNHYVKAIKACKDFKSKYPDIELVPEEEFFRDAPEDIKNSVISKDSAQNLMMKRLNFELLQRKELCKLNEKLEQQKKNLLETIANRKKFLSSLPSHLKSLKKASLPVQLQLGVLHTKKTKQKQLAELLPPPLYVLYSQLVAQKDAFGENIDLEIVGSVKDAQTFARQQANKDTGISTTQDNSKVEDDAPDDEDDGQRRRKRPKKVPAKESLDPAGIYQAHPLKTVLHIHDDEASDSKSKLITLKFEYLLKLNVICVGIEGSNEGPENNILCNLFPDDPGFELPHESAKLCVGKTVVFDEKRTSRPYKWAQHLGGIDFLPEVSPLSSGSYALVSEAAKHAATTSGLSVYRQQNRVETVLQRIRDRKKAQLALADQLHLLMELKWPTVTCDSVPWALHTPLCSLCSWVHIGSLPSLVASVTVSETEQVTIPPETEIAPKPDTSKEEVENAREDGELPSLVAPPISDIDVKRTPSKGSDYDHSKQLALISKSVASPISKGKSLSFKKNDEDADLMMLDSGSDLDEQATEPPTESVPTAGGAEIVDYSWVERGVQEYCLVLNRKTDIGDKNMKLQAKVKIFMEYPLRPPLFTLTLSVTSMGGGSHIDTGDSEWYNELRAMEAEVNVHVMKMIPSTEENYILGHQVCFLAMLFDFYMEEEAGGDKRKRTSVVDIGLCRPVNGGLVSRTFRGRDHRKMISWKSSGCTNGYPC